MKVGEDVKTGHYGETMPMNFTFTIDMKWAISVATMEQQRNVSYQI
jgi:hypothetical protein